MTVTDEQLAEWERLAGSGYVGLYPVILTIRSAVTLLIAAVRAERAENARLRGALQPIADYLNDTANPITPEPWWWTVRRNEINTALAALRPTTGGDNGE